MNTKKVLNDPNHETLDVTIEGEHYVVESVCHFEDEEPCGVELCDLILGNLKGEIGFAIAYYLNADDEYVYTLKTTIDTALDAMIFIEDLSEAYDIRLNDDCITFKSLDDPRFLFDDYMD